MCIHRYIHKNKQTKNYQFILNVKNYNKKKKTNQNLMPFSLDNIFMMNKNEMGNFNSCFICLFVFLFYC